MTYPAAEQSLISEIRRFIEQRKILMLSTLDSSGEPYASCAPFAVAGDVFYVPLNGIAARAVDLRSDPPPAMVLLIEDDSEGRDQAVRTRVIYQVTAQLVPFDDTRWDEGIAVLAQRHGDRLLSLSQFNDFRLFRLSTLRGRFIARSGEIHALGSNSLARPSSITGDGCSHAVNGKRSAA